MKYFNNLPKIEYDGNVLRDIHKKLEIVDSSLTDQMLMKYRLTDGETLQDVSNNLYGTIDYWWLLATLNGIDDVHYDIMIKDEILQKLAKQIQMVSVSNLREYILFPEGAEIYYEINEVEYRGRVVRKYINTVNVDGIETKFYLLDVELYNVNAPILDGTTIFVQDSNIQKLTLSSTGLYSNGENVRQDMNLEAGGLEYFTRGIIIYKEPYYLYIEKSLDEDFVVSNDTFNYNDVVLIGSELNISQKSYVTGRDVLEVETVNQFQVNRYGSLEGSYLYRYDSLEQMNNEKSVIDVIKPSHIQLIKNNINIER